MKIMKLDYDDFRGEIASFFKLDNNSDKEIFDIEQDVFNILQQNEIIQTNDEKDVTLYKVEIEDITCYYIAAKKWEDEEDEERKYVYSIYDSYEEAMKGYEENIKEKHTNKRNIDFDDEDGFIVSNLEDYNGFKILLQKNETIACYRKGNFKITIELNGNVSIIDKKGEEIPLYDKKLIKAIDDGTFESKYEVIDDNWLEICYFIMQ